MIKINVITSIIGGEFNKTVDILTVIEHIKIGHWKNKIEKIRNLFETNELEDAKKIKDELPAFTVSATFKETRKKENVETYTGLLHLDYDKIDNVDLLKEKVKSIPFTFSAFVSPSGKGLKVFVNTDAVLDTHTDAFNSLRSYYDEILGVVSDRSIKDVTRLCFVSYDPNLYLNETSEIFSYLEHIKSSSLSSTRDLASIWNFTAKKENFVEGSRNSFLHLFACNANREGIEINDVIQYASSYSSKTFTLNEIENTVKSVYSNNLNQFGTYAKPAILAKTISLEVDSPFIPEEIYNVLPQTLKDSCNVFNGRERDVYLTAALSVISGGLHNVCGLYANEEVFPNLFSFIVAPPASGKGSMKYAKQLGDCYHDNLLNISKEEFKIYNKEKRHFDIKIKKAKSEQEIEQLIEPEKPKSKIFFIPGNTSSAMLINHLHDNDGLGCICETEADTVTNTLNKEWGGFSDILRKGFQGECISKSRVTDLEFREIKEPKFSFVITGTPNQMDSLITSIQDGLFSRFLFYSYSSELKWKETFTQKITKSKKEIFADFSSDLCDKFRNNEKQLFRMTEKQGKELDKRFSISLNHNVANYSSHVSGVTFRLGLMSFKIAMVLTALRSSEKEIFCSDEDFETAMSLVENVYMPHNLSLLNKYDKLDKSLNVTEQSLLDWMPNDQTFKRSEILEVAVSLNISDRNLSNILKKFVDHKLIKKFKNGIYTLNEKVAFNK
jgi:hypothetical protein